MECYVVFDFIPFNKPNTTQQKHTTKMVENLEGEIWKPVVGYEGYYEASNKGRIKSLPNQRRFSEIILKQCLSKRGQGYYFVELCKNGYHQMKRVNRIVYEAFNGMIPRFEYKGRGNGDKMWIVNHKDENPHNNCIENLELITTTQNNNYGTRTQRAVAKRCINVYQYTIEGIFVKKWESVNSCREYGFSPSHVSECCHHKYSNLKRRHYKGYIWSYTPLYKVEDNV